MKSRFKLIVLLSTVLLTSFVFPDKVTRLFKLIEKKEYIKAREILIEVKKREPNSVVLDFATASLLMDRNHEDFDPAEAHKIVEGIKIKLSDAVLKAQLTDYSIFNKDLIRIQMNAERSLLKTALENGNEAIASFASKYAYAHNVEEAIVLRDAWKYSIADSIGTAKAYADFIKKYPKSAQFELASTKKNQIAYLELLEKQAELDSVSQVNQEMKLVALQDHAKSQSKFISTQKRYIATLIGLGVLFFLFLTYLVFTLVRIGKSRRLISEQKVQLEDKNNHIHESLRYAKYIQERFLPDQIELKRNFKEYFILYDPKDVVSGDFYWFADLKDRFIVAAADCTGHGVPGAFMSMIGHTLLNQIVHKEQVLEPAKILEELRCSVIDSLNKNSLEKDISDGMDMALISVYKDKSKLEYAGAYNSLILVDGDEVREIKADRQPIAKYYDKTEKPFTNHVVDLVENECVYLFSDGYQDQFGGEENKKYSKSKFKNDLLEVSKLSMDEQLTALLKKNADWKGETPKTDDVLVMGLRV